MPASRTSPVLLTAPLAFAVLTVFHPLSHPSDLDSAGRWLSVHVLQLVLSVPLAACVWAVLRGVPGAAARIARACVPVFLVAFAAFDDNWLTGNASVAGYVTSLAWLVLAVAAAVALRGAGADRLAVGLVAASVLFAVGHPPPFGTLGLLALWAGAVRWERTRRRVAAPTAGVPTAGVPAPRTRQVPTDVPSAPGA